MNPIFASKGSDLLARRISYRILDDGRNVIADAAWEEIVRLQYWYNAEFLWTAGKLGLKMYTVFSNEGLEGRSREDVAQAVRRRMQEGKAQGVPESTILEHLAQEGFVTLKKGGYFDGCLASGFTRTAGNEFNAYLCCEFLLKVSRIAPFAKITVLDEGSFIKPRAVAFLAGDVIIAAREAAERAALEAMIENRHVFAIVDPAKYDSHPKFTPTIDDFNDLPAEDRRILEEHAAGRVEHRATERGVQV